MSFIELEKVTRNFDWSMNDLHSHPHYELYYLTKGERTFFLSNELFSISAPCFIVIPPQVLHKTEGGAYERYNVNVDSKYLNAYQASILNDLSLKIIVPNDKDNSSLTEVLENMSNIQKTDKHYNDKINAVFSYFIFGLDSRDNDKIATPITPISDEDASVMRIIKYINENYRENINLDTLCGMHYTSKPTLISNFKRITNHSPIDYLLQIRLNNAKILLATTSKPINVISNDCGFSSPNYFCLIFKKKVHMSPSDYRHCYMPS